MIKIIKLRLHHDKLKLLSKRYKIKHLKKNKLNSQFVFKNKKGYTGSVCLFYINRNKIKVFQRSFAY